MYTEAHLTSFGNFLLTTYGVQVHSTDGKNMPLYPREVSDADVCNWKYQETPDTLLLPSKFQHGDRAVFCCMPDDPSVTSFPGIPCEIIGIHFYPGKVKYDLDLLFVEGQRSRIYNVDSVLVVAEKKS